MHLLQVQLVCPERECKGGIAAAVGLDLVATPANYYRAGRKNDIVRDNVSAADPFATEFYFDPGAQN